MREDIIAEASHHGKHNGPFTVVVDLIHAVHLSCPVCKVDALIFLRFLVHKVSLHFIAVVFFAFVLVDFGECRRIVVPVFVLHYAQMIGKLHLGGRFFGISVFVVVNNGVGECPEVFRLLTEHPHFGAFLELVTHGFPDALELDERAFEVVAAFVYQFFVHLAECGQNGTLPFHVLRIPVNVVEQDYTLVGFAFATVHVQQRFHVEVGNAGVSSAVGVLEHISHAVALFVDERVEVITQVDVLQGFVLVHVIGYLLAVEVEQVVLCIYAAHLQHGTVLFLFEKRTKHGVHLRLREVEFLGVGFHHHGTHGSIGKANHLRTSVDVFCFHILGHAVKYNCVGIFTHIIIEKTQVITFVILHVYLHAGAENGFERKQVVGFRITESKLIIGIGYGQLIEVFAEQLNSRFGYLSAGINDWFVFGIFQKFCF